MTKKEREERRQKKIQYLKDKQDVIIAMSAYSTHNKANVSFDKWHKTQAMARDKHTPLNQQIRKLTSKMK